MVLPMFNLAASIRQEPIDSINTVLIIDGALANPDAVIAAAAESIDTFRINMRNNYPGPEQVLPPAAFLAARDFLLQRQAPALLGLGEMLPEGHARMSIATQSPGTLYPNQRMCHTDDKTCPADQCPLAAVVYLFRDPDLGGTGFYRYRDGVDAAAVWRSYLQADAEGKARIAQQYPVVASPPAYLTASNEFVEQLKVVQPAFNRMLVYRGDIPHAAHLPHPEKLTRNPRHGRMSLNYFSRCRRP